MAKLTDIRELEAIARRVSGQVLQLSHQAGTPHLASALSCVDILVAAYWAVLNIDPADPNHSERDRLILSKGHAATALYSVLAYRGFFDIDLLKTFNESGSTLAEQPSPGCEPGVELATGSLGHGLPVGLGMALAARIQRRTHRVFVILSDGECNEGSVWEAAMMTAAHRLENVAVVIDFNKWQATGRSTEVMCLEPLRKKWEAFGWNACEVDGHNMTELVGVLSRVPDNSGLPVAVVAHTVKGKGVPFMEDDNNWHYRSPNAAELQAATEHLGLA